MSNKFVLNYKPFGNKAILIEWPPHIDESILDEVIKTKQIVLETFKSIEVIPAYNSLTLIFKDYIDYDKILYQLKNLPESNKKIKKRTKRTWKIPVCYDKEFGLDMQDFSRQKKISEKEIIKLHTQPLYTVYCIGFLPGFMYLGGLDEKLFHPRRTAPRLKIPKGSVGIGGQQTGVYPKQSPGGWNIIGNSPAEIFNADEDNPCKVEVGDKIIFYEITKAEYELIKIQVDTNIFNLESEVVHD
ncbi:5-oxoprolinase subunit PxpB [Abyssalbus ytuae]|uniref:5-oxoprolinase subunit PxpB n=1 Tax=Abyssalbus ytuae TaxID=2926907 RepID=A0A9E7CU58_9FLAO|nr:5-oxoprolinase subunit PxpB [Abyssalbus ytuae]UOB17712.1 5-oxoprolinase subunit PxpB [Abyssalbus ytuae]